MAAHLSLVRVTNRLFPLEECSEVLTVDWGKKAKENHIIVQSVLGTIQLCTKHGAGLFLSCDSHSIASAIRSTGYQLSLVPG